MNASASNRETATATTTTPLAAKLVGLSSKTSLIQNASMETEELDARIWSLKSVTSPLVSVVKHVLIISHRLIPCITNLPLQLLQGLPQV